MSEVDTGRRNLRHALARLQSTVEAMSSPEQRKPLQDGLDAVVFALKQLGWNTPRR